MERGPREALGTREPRTAPELAALLLSLLRVVKARRLLEPGDPKLAGVFQQTYRTWQSDLGRRGALDVQVTDQGFREANGRGLLAHPQLDTLRHALLARGVSGLEVAADVDADAFAGFVEVLATDPVASGPDGFAKALAARVPVGVRARSEGRKSVAAPAPADDAASPATGEIGALLRELDSAEGISTYLDLARRLATHAERAGQQGSEVFYTIVEALARHAEHKENDRIREVAQGFVSNLIVGRRREELIRHIAGGDALALRAGQLLLVLGDELAPALLDALAGFSERQQRDRLEAMLVSLGERILPELMRRLDVDDAAELRTAVRLAGETQHPATVHRLGDLLEHADRGVREEAVRALVRVASDDAIAALARALRSAQRGVSELAIAALGTTGSARAVPPLKSALERALEEKKPELAKELIRALGRLGRAEAGAPLAALLQRKARLGAGWLKELHAAAATALGGVPGDEAVGALAQAAQAKEPALRRAAQVALDRRAESLARVGARAVR